MESNKSEVIVGNRTFSIETGKIGKQTDATVVVRYGETVVLVAAVSKPVAEDMDFFPLRMDYREMTYAAGKFPGGFFKREGRPTHKEILTARLMDRPIRPLFPEGYKSDLVVTSIVLSADRVNDPDILSMVGASAVLTLAPNLPFLGPTGSVRVGRVDGQLILNPTYAEMEQSDIDIIIAGTADAVTMIEGNADEISEQDLLEVIEFSREPIRELVRLQEKLAEMLGVSMPDVTPPEPNPVLGEIESKYWDRVMEAHQVSGKMARRDAFKALVEEAKAEMLSETEEGPTAGQIKDAFEQLEKKACRTLIMQGKREDGRALNDVRDISCEVGVLPMVHGSALFTRGETQALVICTLGTSIDEQRVDALEDEYKKKFMLHYNFPPFCVGEARPPRAPSRREIGHGYLAERSLQSVLPEPEKFPYTIRIVSEIMESNGSSSQASVCGGTLCMMDAGVPLRQPVAGVAMGLVREEGETRILTDICGSEDHFGDMDLKIAGTQNGITGVQMDLKVSGVDSDTLMQAFDQAREARVHVLRQMLLALERPRAEISKYAPRLLLVKLPEDKIGAVIGPGGKVIKKIQEETGATVDIEDDGTANISSREAEGAERARDMILALIEEPEVGKVYQGKVVGIKDFGAFVEILPGRDGLVHISELSDGYVKSVEEVCKIGDSMRVKILNVDDSGRIRLSRKALMKEEGASGEATGDATAETAEPRAESEEG